MTSYVHLLGGRYLDNLYALLNNSGSNVEEAEAASVASQLQTTLGEDYLVVNHAYDWFTGKDILSGKPSPKIDAKDHVRAGVYLAKRLDGIPLGVSKIEPLKDLAARVAEKPHAVHYVVINTSSTCLAPILERIKSLPNVRPIVMKGPIKPMDPSNPEYAVAKKTIVFISALLGLAILTTAAVVISLIAHKINRYTGGVLFVLGITVLGFAAFDPVTRNVFTNALKGRDVVLGALRDSWEMTATSAFRQAKEEQIPVLDLLNTYNDRQNVITNGAPNAAGSKFIAEGIEAIVTDWRQGESRVYLQKPEQRFFTASSNPGYFTWQDSVKV